MTHQYRLSFINNTNRDQTNLYVYMQTQAGLYVYADSSRLVCTPGIHEDSSRLSFISED